MYPGNLLYFAFQIGKGVLSRFKIVMVLTLDSDGKMVLALEDFVNDRSHPLALNVCF